MSKHANTTARQAFDRAIHTLRVQIDGCATRDISITGLDLESQNQIWFKDHGSIYADIKNVGFNVRLKIHIRQSDHDDGVLSMECSLLCANQQIETLEMDEFGNSVKLLGEIAIRVEKTWNDSKVPMFQP